jgi:chromate reductase, NAD(P)H dehydrogenase (quinone)
MSQLQPFHLVLISGSLRSHSVNSAVIATIAHMVPTGARAVIYQRMGELPHFNPDNDRDPLPEPVTDLRETLRRADAVLLSTPEYAGSMPGSFKNLLDWTVGSGGLYGLPVGWINPSAQCGAQDTYHALRIVLGRAGADIVETACADIPLPRDAIGATGLLVGIRSAFREPLQALLAAAKMRQDARAEQSL